MTKKKTPPRGSGSGSSIPFIGSPADLFEKHQSMRSGRFAGLALGKIEILLYGDGAVSAEMICDMHV